MTTLLLFLLLKLGPVGIYPPPSTPGVTNPMVTQANIQKTICVANWTSTIRPPASYTTKLKIQQMKDLGLKGSPHDYEEDHLISLEIGGSPTDPKNLWPQPYMPLPGAHQKDDVENFLHRQVCAGKITLAEAQKEIVSDLYKVYLQIKK